MTFKERYKEWWNRQPKWFRWIINRIDTPFDWCKEWLYNEGRGRKVWKYRIIFDCIMMNKVGKCKIVRED